MRGVPERVDSEVDGGVEAGVVYELGLVHAERAGDPAEELEVGAEVEVDGPAGAAVVGGALPGDVELGEVDAVVDGLDAEDGEEQEEDEGPKDVDEGRHPEVLQRRHGWADGLLASRWVVCAA